MSELVLGPIIGGLSSNSVNLWGRTNSSARLHAWIGQQPDMSDAQLVATSPPLTAETGFAGVAPVQGLAPNTHYHYALTLTNAPPNPNQSPFPKFTTFPAENEQTSFTFAFGSCFLPKGKSSDLIFKTIDERRQRDDLRFILMLGDQIYADARKHNSIGKIATTLSDYRQVYAHVWTSPNLRHLLQNLPAFMILDDHEVDDDWTWKDYDRTQAQIPIWNRVMRALRLRPSQERTLPLERVQNALQVYWEHQGMHAPSMISPLSLDTNGQYALPPGDPGSLAYAFTFGAAAFFVLDTRTMRVKSWRGRSILGKAQWKVLEDWLLAVKDRFPVKFIISSSSLLYDLWVDLARDRWSGFPKERHRFLHFLAANDIGGVYVLAGDLHSTHAVRTDLYGPQGRSLPLWEFCSSPFRQNTNWLSSRTFRPIRSGAVKEQIPAFVLSKENFGQVRVNFEDTAAPSVHFEVYNRRGKLLAAVEG
ncbi:MAG: alkaline phosphatase D family protein [Anaerolineales bacterium]|nr:alkaline phosphatase D family protein [Anaerolineales bacterium]